MYPRVNVGRTMWAISVPVQKQWDMVRKISGGKITALKITKKP